MKKLPDNTRNPHHIAAALDLKIGQVREMMRNDATYIKGWGRPSMHPYILSRRHVGMERWPSEDYDLLHKHRKLHDEGKVTMCQGRDGDWFIQYAIPNNVPIKRDAYFFAGDHY